jgi:F420H(2)-dependent quinone reductase
VAAALNPAGGMNPFMALFLRVHRWLLRVTRGRLGGRLGGQSMLLQHTIGRQTGADRASALSYYRDGPNYLVVASNWGAAAPPSWYANLLAQPHARIDVAGRTLAVTARPATPEEQPRLWSLVTAANPQYLRYQAGLARRIPVVILMPTAAS